MDHQGAFKLAQAAREQGYALVVCDEAGSTNDEAMALARAGHQGRVWVVARAQTKGRGRHGRVWISPAGNLYASLLLVDEVPARLAPQFGFVAGIALAGALCECIADATPLRLKWPNDIVFAGAKLAGILLEGSDLGDGRFACVVGIGANCALAPQGLAYQATALADIGARWQAPEDVFLRLTNQFVRALGLFAKGEGFGAIRQEWLSYAAGLGRPVKVITPAGEITGLFRTIDAAGRLILECQGAIRAIEAGDVWFDETADRPVSAITEPGVRR